MRYFFPFVMLFLVGCQQPEPVTSLLKVQKAFDYCVKTSSKNPDCVAIEHKIILVRNIAQTLKNNPLEFGQKVISLQNEIATLKVKVLSDKEKVILKNSQEKLEIHMALIALFESPQ